MFSVKNYSGREYKELAQIYEAIENAVGTKDNEGNKFRLVKLVHKKRGQSVVSSKGYQDTVLVVNADATISIEHKTAGSGSLRFEDNGHRERIARIAHTDHNVKMLVSHWRDMTDADVKDSYTIYKDPELEKELKAKYEEWWKELPEKEQGRIQEMEERRKLTPFQVPPNYGMTKGDQTANIMIQQLADQKAHIKNLEKQLLDKQEAERREGKTPVAPTVEQPKVEQPASPTLPPLPADNYDSLKPFELHGKIREKLKSNPEFKDIDRTWKKDFMLQILRSEDPMSLIKGQT